MNEYVGKICPYCKTEIKEGDEVKVCPECGIPHHAACWEENKGCTTFGCKEQHYEEQHTNPTDVCSNRNRKLFPDVSNGFLSFPLVFRYSPTLF